MNSGGHQSDLFLFRFNLGLMLGSGLASGRVSQHESAASTGVNPDPYTIAVTVSLLRLMRMMLRKEVALMPRYTYRC
ncbi:hypothetical protein HanIR_Chr17g0879391 [Helianthus annuus]|nr:hypothetical protein HanIR_Chr17g0879391 [Helianthus annuus]